MSPPSFVIQMLGQGTLKMLGPFLRIFTLKNSAGCTHFEFSSLSLHSFLGRYFQASSMAMLPKCTLSSQSSKNNTAEVSSGNSSCTHWANPLDWIIIASLLFDPASSFLKTFLSILSRSCPSSDSWTDKGLIFSFDLKIEGF